MHGQIHFCNSNGIAVLFLSIENNSFRSVLPFLLDEVAGLDEHATGAAGGIEDRSMIRLNDVDDNLDERGRSKKFAVVMRLLNRELGEEVFVNPAENIASGLLYPFAVKEAHKVFENSRVIENPVIFGQNT